MATSKEFVKSTDKASDAVYEFSCSPCVIDGRNSEAIKYCPECKEYLCSRCAKEHSRFAALRFHQLQDTAAMKGCGPPPAIFVAMERCPIHHGNTIDTYCGNHDAVCCPTCVSVDHRSCVGITYVVDAAIDITKSQEYKTIKGTIAKVQTKVEQLKKIKQLDRNRLDREKRTCLTKIQDFRKKINKHFDDLEKAATRKIEDKHKEYEDRVNSDINKLDQMISTLEASLDQLEKVNTDNEPQVFVNTKMGKRSQNKGEELLQKMKASPNQESKSGSLNFKINAALEEVIESVKSLGEIVEADDENQLYKASLIGRYDEKVKGETDCNIYGSFMQQDGTLLITDGSNCNLKRLDQSYKVRDSCKLTSRPWGVCTTDPGEAAVVLGNDQNIQFVSLGDSMATTKSFKIGQYCHGVAYNNKELFVSCQQPGQIKTFNTDGKLLRMFQTDASGRQMFSSPWHIAVSTDHSLIHVADKDNGIITLDRQENKLAQFSDPDLTSTHGVCTGVNGQLFVCGHRSNNVLQISRGGQKLGVLLDESVGVKCPVSACYDPVNSRLIVTMTQTDNIAVFKLSRKYSVQKTNSFPSSKLLG